MTALTHLVVTPTHQTENDAPFSTLSKGTLLRMADAGAKVVDCIRDLNAAGSNLVIETLRGSNDFTEWAHYPPNDVYDMKSHAQYYFHAHPPDDRDAADYGHFHTFLRRNGMPLGIQPAKVKGHVPAAGESDAPSHLIAISMTPGGMPEALFTTNRWVTGETWYGATDVTAMLDHFVIDLDQPSPLLNQWLTAMFILFRPQIEELVIQRDRTILQWQVEYADVNVFEDRRLEITSSKKISLYRQIEWLDQQLDASLQG